MEKYGLLSQNYPSYPFLAEALQREKFCRFLFAFLGGETLYKTIALRKAKIAYNFGLSECNRVKRNLLLKATIALEVHCTVCHF